MNNDWDEKTCAILEKIRLNCVLLSDKHKNKFYAYKSYSNYFDLPILCLSAVSSPLSVGSQGYLKQELISIITCSVGVVIAIITSIKLYLNINDTLERENKVARDFYVVAVDIFKTLSLPQDKRGEDCIVYFNKTYNTYIKLLEQSTLLKKRFKQDQLTCLPDSIYFSDESNSESSSGSSTPRNKSVMRVPFPIELINFKSINTHETFPPHNFKKRTINNESIPRLNVDDKNNENCEHNDDVPV